MIETVEANATSYEAALVARTRALTKRLPGSEIYPALNVGAYSAKKPASVGVYPNGLGKSEVSFFHADTLAEALDLAEAWIETNGTVRRNEIVRQMALAIISLTDEHGACTLRDLSRQFAAAIIETHREDALARAAEMAGNAPFAIVDQRA